MDALCRLLTGRAAEEHTEEKKPAASPKGQETQRGQQEHHKGKIIQSLLSRESAEDAVIRHFEETEGSRKIIANLAEGNNSDMEKVHSNLHGDDGIGR